MNKIISGLFISFFLLIFVACSSDDIVINNYVEKYSFLVNADSNVLQKMLITKDSVTFSDIDLEQINIGKINIMKKFRGKFYLLSSENKKIFVVTEKTYNIVEVDYSALNLTPTDICFPNATDAYVAHNNDSNVTILDLTNNQISGIRIPIGDFAGGIAGAGNQVHVTLPNKNLVKIIDTRTNTVKDSVIVTNKPTLIEFASDGTKSFVVSVGNGKENNSTDNKEPAKLTVIDVVKKNIVSDAIISTTDAAINMIPTSIAVTSKYIHIASKNLVTTRSTIWKIATTNFKTTTSITKYNSEFIAYDDALDVIYLIDKTADKSQIILLNGTTNSTIKSVVREKLPISIVAE